MTCTTDPTVTLTLPSSVENNHSRSNLLALHVFVYIVLPVYVPADSVLEFWGEIKGRDETTWQRGEMCSANKLTKCQTKAICGVHRWVGEDARKANWNWTGFSIWWITCEQCRRDLFYSNPFFSRPVHLCLYRDSNIITPRPVLMNWEKGKVQLKWVW